MMGKGKTKRILLGIMLCGAVCNAAYAGETIPQSPEKIPTNTDPWTIGIGDGQYQFISGEYIIEAGGTITMQEMEEHSSGTAGDALNDNTGSGLIIHGSEDGDGNLSKLAITGYGTSYEAAINSTGTGSDITLDNVDLDIHNYSYALETGSEGSISITNKNILVSGSGSFYQGGGSLTINTGTLDVSVVGNAVYVSGEGSIANITADTMKFTYTGTTSGRFGIHSAYGGDATLTGDKIVIDGFAYGVDVQSEGLVNIIHTGTGADNTLDIINNSTDGISVRYDSFFALESDGIININNNGDGLYANNTTGQPSYTEDGYGITVTGQGNTVINLKGNSTSGMYAYADYGIHVQNVKEINISDTLTGAGLWVRSSYHGIDIEKVQTMSIDSADVGIFVYYDTAKYDVNITDAGSLTIKNCIDSGDSGDASDCGIYSAANYGVNIAAADSVTFDNNLTGIYTNKVDGVTITGYNGDLGKLTFNNNGRAIYATSGGTVDFAATELEAKNNNILAWANGTGTGGTDDSGTAYASHSSAINLTADKATITGQIQDGNTSSRYVNDYTFYAEGGGNITLDVKEITASREKGYFAYADTNEDSKIEIKADKGTIKGAFWTGDTANTTADSSGIINLDLGTSAEWTVTQDSKLTELTLGDASALAFAPAGPGSWTHLYTNNLYSNDAGSTITMNIDGTALNQSDHIYVMGEHTGTSSVLLRNTSGRDLTDDVIGTKLVSVGTESGRFTSGGYTYEGALKWYEYTIDSVNTADGEKTVTGGKTVSATDGYGTDWYISGYSEADDDEGDGGGGGGPGPAQPDGNTTTVDAVIAANAVNYYAFREQDKLLRRMGELRNNGEDEQGVWIRVKGAKTGRSGSFENKYVHYEGGYDTLVKNDHREKRYEGFSISHTEGDVKYKEVTGSGKAHDEEIAFYRVDQYKHGHYLDLVTRIGIYNNRFGVYDTNRNKISARNHNYGISTSAEYGRKKDYAHGWYVEPQTQATLGYLSGSDYTTSNGVDVSNGSISSAVGRIGVNIGKGFTDKNGRRGKFYAKANWLKEFLGSYGIDMVSDAGNRVHAHGNYKDTWFEWGFGVTYQYTKNNFFYADVEKSEGSSYYKNWAWNVGLRWTFN